MRFETKHTLETGEDYFGHLGFCIRMFLHLSLVSFFFVVHGFLPWIPMPGGWDLDRTSRMLTHEAKKKSDARAKTYVGRW